MKYSVIFRIGYRLGGQSYSFRQREALMGPMQYPMHLGQMRVCTITAIGHLAGYISHNSALSNFSSMLNLPLLTTGVQWQEENGLHFARWDESTTDTPYKRGLTSVSSGFQIGGRVSGNNQFWILIDASGRMFRSNYSRDTGTWTEWKEIS